MGIIDRVILTLYTFIMALIALLVVIYSTGLIPVKTIITTIIVIPGSWEYTVGGVIVFLLSIRLLLAGIGVFGQDLLVLEDNESGKSTISKRALEHYISDVSQEVYGIYGVKVAVRMHEDKSIDAHINASLEPGVNVFVTTEEVKDNIKETIKKVVGLEINEVEFHFKNIKSNNKQA